MKACNREVIDKDGKRKQWVPSKYQKLCSCHFEERNRPDPKSRTKENKQKIPTLFDHNPAPRKNPVSSGRVRYI